MMREEEELYTKSSDKYERNNLAYETKYNEVKMKLSTELEKWMNEFGDPGAELDTKKEFEAQRKGNHFIQNRGR